MHPKSTPARPPFVYLSVIVGCVHWTSPFVPGNGRFRGVSLFFCHMLWGQALIGPLGLQTLTGSYSSFPLARLLQGFNPLFRSVPLWQYSRPSLQSGGDLSSGLMVGAPHFFSGWAALYFSDPVPATARRVSLVLGSPRAFSHQTLRVHTPFAGRATLRTLLFLSFFVCGGRVR